MINSYLFNGLFVLLISYLIGSFPSGYLAGKWCAGLDIRKVGSGSTGATNVLRQVGKAPAIAVFIVDVSKGILPVVIAYTLGENWQVAAGITALAGHIWPIWLGWKGGKAVATGLGMLLGLSWPVGLACFGIFLAVFSLFKTVSLASITAALSLPLLMFFSFSENQFSHAYFYLSLATMLMVIWRHRANIRRLLQGKEPKVGQSN